MSHWDFGHPTDGQHDGQPDGPRRSGPAGAPYPPDLPGSTGDDAWPPQDAWPADAGWPARDGWPAGAADEGWPGGDGWDGDEGTAPYPLTYERDDLAVADPQPAATAREPWEPWPPAAYPAELKNEDPADWGGGAARGGARRWLLLGGVMVAGAAVGAAAVLLTSGHPGTRGGQGAGGPGAPPATPSAVRSTPASAATAPSAAGPLTLAQAKGVLAGYTTVNNGANAQRSDTLLASVESGSSYAIDAGLYQEQQAAGTAPYPAFGPVQATYYIPRDQPASGPRWFVVQVANAFTSNPEKVTSDEYLLFTQSAPGGAWQDTIEPYLLSGASAPRITVGADGLATAVSPDAASVAVAPGQLPAATAASLDGTGTGQPAIADPGNLADRGDQKFWQGQIAGATVTDTRAPAAGADGQEFALLTSDGGALAFYTDAAEVTITPPSGSALRLAIPGFYSPSQDLSRAGVSYLEQFATYDPPAGGGAPRVVADYSGITGKG
jgi:hypothetical protein